MDGCDVNGNKVRKSLLKTDDEFRIYNMLYDTISNLDAEIPENENDKKLVTEFFDNLPNLPLETEREIMEKLNAQNTHKHKEIFTNVEQPQESADESDDENGKESDDGHIDAFGPTR